jgi:protein-S-isoprenylcysteine O-methyltransferase Ste14
MYCALIPLAVGTTLLLGSWYGLLLGLILVVIIALRAAQEERVLRAELTGYDASMARVKYRLISYAW